MNNDEAYLKIWEIEQKHTTTRWTVATFFFSVSFAVFAFSLQVERPRVPSFVPQMVAVVIYWFAYFLFMTFNDFSRFLRQRLEEMEATKQTTLDLQTRSKAFMSQRRRLTSTKLLFVFGIVYSFAGLAIGFVFRH